MNPSWEKRRWGKEPTMEILWLNFSSIKIYIKNHRDRQGENTILITRHNVSDYSKQTKTRIRQKLRENQTGVRAKRSTIEHSLSNIGTSARMGTRRKQMFYFRWHKQGQI